MQVKWAIIPLLTEPGTSILGLESGRSVLLGMRARVVEAPTAREALAACEGSLASGGGAAEFLVVLLQIGSHARATSEVCGGSELWGYESLLDGLVFKAGL